MTLALRLILATLSIAIIGPSCTAQDLGAQINAFGPAGTFSITNGTYTVTTPISITQSGSQTLHIVCSSRQAVLNFSVTGNAISINGSRSPTAQVSIENCTLNGSSSAGDAIYAYDSQNLRLTNNSISGFTSGAGVHGYGMIGALLLGNNISGNKYGIYLQPDAANSFASNANRVYGGSLTYDSVLNFWDEGNASVYGGDTSNTLDGVTFESNTNVPQFLVEGTWNDAIINSYIEYIGYPTSSGNLYAGIVGNLAGSGYGSNTTYPANSFRLDNVFFITPRAGSGSTTASILAENTANLNISTITDEGAPTYFMAFSSAADNVTATVGPSHVGWQVGQYLSPPPSASLWVGAVGIGLNCTGGQVVTNPVYVQGILTGGTCQNP